jgi:phenylalanyl-tRNA synthetase beta chain
MRRHLLPGVLAVTAENLKHTGDVRLFEVGPVYLPRLADLLPDEPRRLAVVLTGRRQPEFWGEPGAGAALDFFDLKGVVEALVSDLHLAGVGYRPSAASYLHPGRAAELLLAGQPVGSFGELHPLTAEKYDLGKRAVLAAELDLEAILQAVPARYTYTPIPRFPAALRDLAVIVPEGVPAERVEAEIRAAGGDLLSGVRLFDLYRGESIPAGTRSLAYALSFQAPDKTLTDKAVDQVHRKIEDRLEHVLGGQIRRKD